MYKAATFEYSVFLELAITELEQNGIPRENIYAFPLKSRVEERKIFDTISRADGISLFDGAAILSTIFMVLGVIYGYVLAWGPLIWGLIGMVSGAVLGFLLDVSFTKLFNRRERTNKAGGVNKAGRVNKAEVVLIIECSDQQKELVEKVLWENNALGIG